MLAVVSAAAIAHALVQLHACHSAVHMGRHWDDATHVQQVHIQWPATL